MPLRQNLVVGSSPTTPDRFNCDTRPRDASSAKGTAAITILLCDDIYQKGQVTFLSHQQHDQDISMHGSLISVLLF